MRYLTIAALIFCCSLLPRRSLAQNTGPLLTLREAVEIALKNNYDIKIAQNNKTVAQNNVTPGNAGFYPQVGAGLSTNNSRQNIVQTRSDGTVNTLNGIRNSSVSYGPTLNWTIFNGFAMFANLDELKQLNQLSDVRLKDTIQSTVSDVIQTYYDLINQNEQIKALRGAIAISRTQLRYANDKFTVGRGSGLDVLNAQVNLNTDTANMITEVQQFKTNKVRMNQLLIRDLQTEFSVADTIIVDQSLKLGDILSKAQTENPNILASEINKRLADINLRQVRAARYPVISLGGGYAITDNKTPAGFTQAQSVHGFNYGVTASVNIFNGFTQNLRERNARIQIDNSAIGIKQNRLNVEAQINNLYISYLTGLDLVKLEQSDVEIARRNLDISLEKYRLGNITPLEIREAQRNYLDAQSKFFNAQYQAKAAETTLKQLINRIDIQ